MSQRVLDGHGQNGKGLMKKIISSSSSSDISNLKSGQILKWKCLHVGFYFSCPAIWKGYILYQLEGIVPRVKGGWAFIWVRLYLPTERNTNFFNAWHKCVWWTEITERCDRCLGKYINLLEVEGSLKRKHFVKLDFFRDIELTNLWNLLSLIFLMGLCSLLPHNLFMPRYDNRTRYLR